MTLLIQNLKKEYNKILAVDSVSFSVKKGEVIGLLGENGAGKTTLINLITSIIKPSSGTVKYENYDYGSKEYKQNIGATFGGEISLYERLTVKENLKYYASLYGIKDSESRISFLKERLKFGDYENKRIEQLSRGMKQRITLAVSLINDPELILLDEPTIGLDVSGQRAVKEVVQYLKSKDRVVLYSTNIISEVKEICDKVVIINKGKLVEFDTIQNIENKYHTDFENIFFEITRR